jgi:hypothetical protein
MTTASPGPRNDRAVFIERIMLAKTREDAAALYGEIWSVLIRQALTWSDGMHAERRAMAERIAKGRVSQLD